MLESPMSLLTIVWRSSERRFWSVGAHTKPITRLSAFSEQLCFPACRQRHWDSQNLPSPSSRVCGEWGCSCCQVAAAQSCWCFYLTLPAFHCGRDLRFKWQLEGLTTSDVVKAQTPTEQQGQYTKPRGHAHFIAMSLSKATRTCMELIRSFSKFKQTNKRTEMDTFYEYQDKSWS